MINTNWFNATALQNRIFSVWFQEWTPEQPFPFELGKKWFTENKEFDQQLKNEFDPFLKLALKEDPCFDPLKDSPFGCLSFILLMDQFPRNMYRSTSDMFLADEKALSLAHHFCSQEGWERDLHPLQRVFVYMPFEHAENATSQSISVQKFTQLANEDSLPEDIKPLIKGFLDFSLRHQSLIQRFGRFPYRNSILGRTSTPEELEYLEHGEDYVTGKNVLPPQS